MEQLLSMSKIFSEKIFRIPDYQRGYAWTLKEVEDFWGDLCRLENKKNHYVGVLTLEPVNEGDYKKWIDDLWIIEAKRYVPYYIVDGQQRLTTSIILIYVICQIMQIKNIEKLNYTTNEEISRKFIYEYQDKNKNRTYMFSYEYDNPSYAYLISKIYDEKVISTLNENETIYTNNLEQAKQFFYEKLKVMNIKQLEDIYTKITQHFLFNMYIITDDIDVYVTFETMNNRGKLLSNLELLKNRLIYITTLFKVEEVDKKRLRRDINECWKKIYHILGKNKERALLDDEFLITHFMIYFANYVEDLEKEKYKRRIYRFGEWQSNYLLNDYFVIQKVIDNSLSIEDCFNYIQSLSECIDCWGDIKNPVSSKYNDEIKEYIGKINFFSMKKPLIYKIEYMFPFSYQNVFLLACFKICNNDSKMLLKFLKNLEKYLFTLEFYMEVIEEINKYILNFSDIIIKLNKKELNLKQIISKLEILYKSMINSEELNKKIILYYAKNGFYKTSWLRYFLYEYEFALKKKSKSNIEKLNSWDIYERGYNSIEHIYPINSFHKYWITLFKEYNSKQQDALKNSLGNFVVISQEKNGKLGNKAFSEKKSNAQNSIGYKYGTYAEIEISEYEDWDSNAILNRGLKLIAFLYERWGIKIGSGQKEDKIKFLGLEFLG